MIKNKQKIVIGLVTCFILSVCYPAMGLQTVSVSNREFSSVKNSNIFKDFIGIDLTKIPVTLESTGLDEHEIVQGKQFLEKIM